MTRSALGRKLRYRFSRKAHLWILVGDAEHARKAWCLRPSAEAIRRAPR